MAKLVTLDKNFQLETDRLILRRLVLADAEAIYPLIRSKDVSRWLLRVPYPYPDGLAEKFIRSTHKNWRNSAGFTFAVTLKNSGKLIGCAGLEGVTFKHECAEIGYWLGKRYWNKGYGTEFAKGLVRFGFDTLKLNRLYAVVIAANTYSPKVLKNAGFIHEGTMREAMIASNKRQDMLSFGMLRSDYKKV